MSQRRAAQLGLFSFAFLLIGALAILLASHFQSETPSQPTVEGQDAPPALVVIQPPDSR